MREAGWIHGSKGREGRLVHGSGGSTLTRRLMAKRDERVNNDIQRWEQMVAAAKPPFKQCQHLIRKFGGIVPFAVAAGVHPEEIIQYWLASPYVNKPGRNRGKTVLHIPTGGFVPSAFLPKLLVVARYFGILITPQDLYPDFSIDNKKEDYDRWIKSIKKSVKMSELEDELASLVSTPDLRGA